MLNGAAISWKSKRQSVVALSTAEAEFIAASTMVQEVIYARRLLDQLGFPQPEPASICEDKTTCVKRSEGSVGGSDGAKRIHLRGHFVHDAVGNRTKCSLEMDTLQKCSLREHFVHEAVDNKILKLEPVDSADKAADLLVCRQGSASPCLETRQRISLSGDKAAHLLTRPLLKAPFWALRKLLLGRSREALASWGYSASPRSQEVSCKVCGTSPETR